MPSTSADWVPAGARERITAAILRLMLKLALKPVLSAAVPVAHQRRRLYKLARWTRPATGVVIEPGVLGGIPGEWLRRANAGTRGTILYLHGGAYCVGSPATHRTVTSQLARATGQPVFAADYRLAPEHPLPAAIEDAVSACQALSELGPFVIAGDSAGGGLALAVALALRQRQASLPAALVLFSPWIDLAIPHSERANDPMLSRGWLAACARQYLAGADPKAPFASPIHGDLRGLPPTLIQTGSDDLLHCDAIALYAALGDAGVETGCEVVAGRWHVFQLHAGLLPSADAAIERAANFIAHKTRPGAGNQNIG